MVQAIGSSSTSYSPTSGASAGVLQAQLTRYQLQLADWCNCPSGKTPQGQAKIQQLQNQADAVKAQLERMDAVKGRQVASPRPVDADVALGGAGSSTTAQASASGTSGIGGLVDTFA